MSHSSRESKLAQLREALLQHNSEFFLSLKERRLLTVKIQELKRSTDGYPHYDPSREKEVFTFFSKELKSLSIKELLAFSLIMEDHATNMAPGSYPSWSSRIHIKSSENHLHELINPLMLKVAKADFFQYISLSNEFSFLKDF
jgi:chorismate mutase